MVVGDRSWLHEGELEVGCESLLLEPGIHIAKMVIKVDFCWNLLLEMVTRVQNFSTKICHAKVVVGAQNQ